MGTNVAAIREVAKRVFQYSSLRPGQEAAIAAVLAGRDTLAVMPTGSGKSAIYQIAALMLDGPTVVVSPLIALQKDQSDRLEERNAGGAEVVNSLIPQQAQADAIKNARSGATEFLFLAPEQFANPARLQAIKAARPSLFVIDEAHCISEWGHSFRPDYLNLAKVVEELGHPTVLALTATASPRVRVEIIQRADMRDPRVIVHGFDRPNIWLGVEIAASDDKKRGMLLDRIQQAGRPGIVYATTRKHAEDIKEELNSVGIPAAFYHGGLRKRERTEMQERFMQDEVQVIVATSAFGMGVDKANVRFVFHYEPPGSLDSYYQEIGRGGRDGDEASAVLFYRSGDLNIHKFFKGAGQIRAEEVERVLRAVQDGGALDGNSAVAALSKTKVARILRRLEDSGAIQADAQGTLRLAARAVELHAIAGEAAQAQSERHQADLERIEKMRQYAENLGCRRALLLGYFGEEVSGNCGNCDNCQGEGTERARLISATQARAAEPPQTDRA